MPKVIEGLQQRILDEALKLLRTEGYTGLTVRDIARSCNIAPGTVYNYYKSKEVLVAHIISREWYKTLQDMDSEIQDTGSIHEGLGVIAKLYNTFADSIRGMLKTYTFDSKSSFSFPDRHQLLIKVLQKQVQSVFSRFGKPQEEPVLWMISETMISASNIGRSWDSVSEVAERIIK